ncbi:MAG: tetratricopeptide repeat protein [Trebonia sp.]
MTDRPPLRDYSRSRAVVMGTWDYDHLPPVPPAENSLRRMISLLTGPLCGWPRERITTLANLSGPGDIPDQLITAFESTTDVALFYYVGHGQIDRQDELCLGLAASSSEPNHRTTTSLPFQAVRSALLDCPAATKIVVLDCCFAGLANQPANTLAAFADDVIDKAGGTGAYTMAATSAYATAWYEGAESAEEPQTFFTKYFVDLVQAGMPGKPAALRIHQLFLGLRDNLARDQRPVPQERSIDAAREFVFAHNAAPPETHFDPDIELQRLSLRMAQAERREQARLAAEIVSARPPNHFEHILDQPTNVTANSEAIKKFRDELREEMTERFPRLLADHEFLQMARLLVDGRLTKAAGLLFAKEATEVNPAAMVHCARYLGVGRDSPREVEKLEGPLRDQIVAAREFVSKHTRVGEFPSYSQSQSADSYAYPMIAVREIIANALVHRDYAVSNACIHVRLFADRLEVTSPGTWLGRELEEGAANDLSDLVGESVKRNIRLANILSWIRLVEGEGSGVPSALQDCRMRDVSAPSVVQQQGFITVTFSQSAFIKPDRRISRSPGRPLPAEKASPPAGKVSLTAEKASPPAERSSLPADIAGFVGRESELLDLAAFLRDEESTAGRVSVSVIDGMAGVGKTALAVHAANMFAGRFTDGRIFLPLHAYTPGQPPVEPAEALTALLLRMGISPQSIPTELNARQALWRDVMATSKTLVLLDDAASSEQVIPLLPTTAETRMLITSRRRLTGLDEALQVPLDVLPAAEAAELFVRVAHRRELSPQDEAVAELARLCGYLPLAIKLAAGLLSHHPSWTPVHLATELAAEGDRLAGLSVENSSVAASFGWSYNNLRADLQKLFRRLGSHPGTGIDVYAAAALNNTDEVTTARLLDDLFSDHLIDEPAPGRYRFHDLIHEYARALAGADSDAETSAATDRLLDYYLYTARTADRQLSPRRRSPTSYTTGTPPASAPHFSARDEATAWLGAERLNLAAVTRFAASEGRTGHAIDIAAAMHAFLRLSGYWDEALALHSTALDAARASGSASAEAKALENLGEIHHLRGEYPAATTSLTTALRAYRDFGDHFGQANVLRNLGVVQRLTGDYQSARASLAEALNLSRSLGDRLGEAEALNDMGELSLGSSSPAEAISYHQEALAVATAIASPLEEARAFEGIGQCQIRIGESGDYAASLQQALAVYQKIGSPNAERVKTALLRAL